MISSVNYKIQSFLQHFKDIMNIRRTDGELLKKYPSDMKKFPKDASTQTGDSSNGDSDLEMSIVLPRDRCIPVVRGLMALLLSMDFTCNVDLFLISCKVRYI